MSKTKHKSEADYFTSKEFLDAFKQAVKDDTWEKGYPMVYTNDKNQIVRHWKNGKIEIIKDLNKK